MDVLEIDAASHTGIENVRETILESININPVRDRYKVFIIDEVHQLSKPAFNALLKTLEEPPANVVFVMATTELHKVPETIRSRCQEFDFRTIPLQKIFDRLKLIAAAEKIKVDEAALREIARSGMGSMRDAQSNFDQVISFSGEKITTPDVSNALGIASTDMLVKVLSAVAETSPKLVLEVVAELVSRGQDARNFCRDLLAVFRDLMVFKVSGGDSDLVETSALTPDQLSEYANGFEAPDFVRFFNSLCETESKLKEAVQPRYVLETGLVKLTEMRRVVPIEQLLERLSQLEQVLAGGIASETRSESSMAATAEKKTLISEPAVLEPEPQYASPDLEPEPPEEYLPPPPDFEPEFLPSPPPAPIIDLGFLDAMPVKLAPIDSEALEHVEDTWLDSAYERKLVYTGDDLLRIPHASAIAQSLLGRNGSESHANGSTNGAASAAAAPALSPVYTAPDLSSADEDTDPGILPENATEEEMIAFASNHPLTKKAMRIFRAKIVEVKPA